MSEIITAPSGDQVGASAEGVPRRRTRSRRQGGSLLRITAWRVALIAALLALWEVYSRLDASNEFFVSRPLLIMNALGELLESQAFYVDLRYTLVETAIGFLIGAVAGVIAGFALAFSRTLYAVVEPIVNALNCLPRIALSSLFILWFGLGMQSKIALVVSLVFFPLFLNAYKGATTVDPDQLLLMHTFRASRLAVVRKVIIPSTAPWVITGAKLGIAQALAGAVVGEIIAAQHGLGAALSRYANTFATAEMMAVLVVLIVIAVLLNAMFSSLEARTSSWR